MPTSTTNHSRYSLHQEIAALRTAIRSARHALRKGTVDPLKASLIIARSSNTLITLIQLQRDLDDQQRHQEHIATLRQNPNLASIFQPNNTPSTTPDPTPKPP